MKTLCLSIFILIMLTMAGCGAGIDTRVRTESVMGTFVTISVTPGTMNGEIIDKAVDAAFTEMRRIDGLMSTYLDDSELSMINRTEAGQVIDVSSDMVAVLDKSFEIYRVTSNAFDVTVGPLVALWGFGSEAQTPNHRPPDTAIENTMALTGMDLIDFDIDRHTVALDSTGMSIDLSGIAKGYAVDRALDVLRNAGVEHALVNAGGDVAAFGGKTNEIPWTVGIQRPVRNAGLRQTDIIARIPVTTGAVATSGTYEQYVTIDGTTFSHVIDPRTGIPRRNVPSATVTAPECATADALATGLLVLGPDEGMAVVESIDGVEALLLSHEAGRLTARQSSGWTAASISLGN